MHALHGPRPQETLGVIPPEVVESVEAAAISGASGQSDSCSCAPVISQNKPFTGTQRKGPSCSDVPAALRATLSCTSPSLQSRTKLADVPVRAHLAAPLHMHHTLLLSLPCPSPPLPVPPVLQVFVPCRPALSS
jgi:hypothetical protein